MAELLIIAKSATNPDPIKDKTWCYKVGDIVAVGPDDYDWGNQVCLPKFCIVKIPNVDHKNYTEYECIHKEQRDRVLSWNKLDWEVAVDVANFEDFVDCPVVSNEIPISKSVDYKVKQWVKMQVDNYYYPFYEKPLALPKSETMVTLIGNIITVNLQGIILETITIRKYKMDLDQIDFIDGKATLTVEEVTNRIKDKTKENKVGS